MSTLKRYSSALRNIHPDLGKAWDELDRLHDTLSARTGGSQPTFVDSPTTTPVAPTQPQAARFSVTASGGVFAVQITNPQHVQPSSVALARAQAIKKPNAPLSAIYHNLQSATDVNFDSASSLTDYGISTQVAWNIPNANATLYWRLRSSFDGKNFNPFQVFVAAGNSGPTAVSS